MARCSGLTRAGDQCTATVASGNDYCYAHDPAKAEERKRNASRAGKSRAGSRVKALDQQLAKLYEDTLAGVVDKSVAAVLTQIVYGRTRLLEVERKAIEQQELLERLERLESQERDRGGRRSW